MTLANGLKLTVDDDPTQPGDLAGTNVFRYDVTGTLVAGQRADLLVCTEDVIADPARLASGALLEVIKDGEAYRNGLPELPQRRYETDLRERLWAKR